MNALDSTFVLICLAFLALGVSHGLIKSISSFIAIIVGLYSAKKIEPFISTLLSAVHIHNPKGLLGYLFVFFCIYITVKIVLLLLRKVTKASGLSPVDRTLGGLLGLAKGIIAVVIMCMVMQVFLPENSAILRNSRFLPYTRKLVSSAHVLLPNGIYRNEDTAGAKGSAEPSGSVVRKSFSTYVSKLIHKDDKAKAPDR